CISCPVSIRVWPPSCRIPTSKETRVRVDWRSKIMASTLSLSSNGRSPSRKRRLRSWARSRMPRRVAASKSFKSRKCLSCPVIATGPDCNRDLKRGDGLLGRRGLALDVFQHGGDLADRFLDIGLLDDERRQKAQHVVPGRDGQQLVTAQPGDEIPDRRGDLDAGDQPLAAHLEHEVREFLRQLLQVPGKNL